MKKQLLLFISAMLLCTVTFQAQNKVWDFGNNSGGFWEDLPAQASGSMTIDGLTFNANTSSWGGMRDIPSATTWAEDPDYTPTQEWPSGGSSSGTAALPSRRFFSFPVDDKVTIKVWFRVNGTGARTCYISDGVNVLGSATNEVATDGLLLTASYPGPGAGTIYISSSAAINYHKIQVATPLSVEGKLSPVSTNVHAIGNRVYVSNVKSTSEINVYSITGALVKSFKTNVDTDFNFNLGLFIATIRTSEGQKAVKFVTN